MRVWHGELISPSGCLVGGLGALGPGRPRGGAPAGFGGGWGRARPGSGAETDTCAVWPGALPCEGRGR